MNRSSQSGRIWAAVALTMAFYGLAVIAAVALLAVPVVEIVFMREFALVPAILCPLAGLLILASVRPPIDRFQPPGARLTEEEQPRLFALIEELAALGNQPPPAEVYLVSDAAVSVTERGGVLGFGERRVMTIGLPLLQGLSLSQLRGVIAHEFGRYHWGNTGLARWAYRTRAAMERALIGLGPTVVRMPFVWFAKQFLRITAGISRRHEFAADAFAVEIDGRRNYIDALRRMQVVAAAFEVYWHSDVMPVLASGFRTPIAGGFEQFLLSPRLDQQIAAAIAAQQAKASELNDARPTMAERLAEIKIEAVPEGDPPAEPQAAITLIDKLSDQEVALLRFRLGQERATKLRSIAWQDVGRQVFVPLWRKSANEFSKIFRDISIVGLPELARSPEALRQAVVEQAGKPLTEAEQAAAVENVLGLALAQSLAALNWEPTALPGADVELQYEGTVIAPFREVLRWIAEPTAAEGWPSLCKELEIVEAPVLWPEKATVEVSLDELSSRIMVNKSKKPAASPVKPTA